MKGHKKVHAWLIVAGLLIAVLAGCDAAMEKEVLNTPGIDQSAASIPDVDSEKERALAEMRATATVEALEANKLRKELRATVDARATETAKKFRRIIPESGEPVQFHGQSSYKPIPYEERKPFEVCRVEFHPVETNPLAGHKFHWSSPGSRLSVLWDTAWGYYALGFDSRFDAIILPDRWPTPQLVATYLVEQYGGIWTNMGCPTPTPDNR